MDERDSNLPLMNAVRTIIQRLNKIEDFEPFQSLPPKSLKHYHRVVHQPVSFKSITANLRKYQSLTDVYMDFKLIGQNCRFYNQDGSVLYNLSEDLDKEIKRLFKRYDLDREMEREKTKGSTRFLKQAKEWVKSQNYKQKLAQQSKMKSEPIRSSSRIRDDSEEDYFASKSKTASKPSKIKMNPVPRTVQKKQQRNKILNKGKLLIDLAELIQKAGKKGNLAEFMKNIEDQSKHGDVVNQMELDEGVAYSLNLTRLEDREIRRIVEKKGKYVGDSDSFDDM